MRLTSEAPRYLLYAACTAGLAASARFALDPPRAKAPAPAPASASPPDLGAEGFASLFARRYLTWNAAEPQAHVAELAATGVSGEGAGEQLPARGSQRVLWTQVVQQRVARRGESVYTVAAQTDADGLVYLTVDVARVPGGGLALAGYPAFVGPPGLAPAQLDEATREVADPSLFAVVSRTMRNYLAGSPDELAADLTPGARVSVPVQGLGLGSVQRLSWSPDGRSVIAVVRASDQRDAAFTLGYELDVIRAQGRWEVSAVQMDPYT
jgi:hypothetical protein